VFAVDGNGRTTAWVYVDSDGVGHYTRGQRPQPFLTPAAEDNIQNIVSIVKENLKKGM
jgi:hypothetical protein